DQWEPELLDQLLVEAEVVDVVLAGQAAASELQELADRGGVERPDPLRLRREVDPAEPRVADDAVAAPLPIRRDRAAPDLLLFGVAQGDDLRHQIRTSSACCSCPRRRRNA